MCLFIDLLKIGSKLETKIGSKCEGKVQSKLEAKIQSKLKPHLCEVWLGAEDEGVEHSVLFNHVIFTKRESALSTSDQR